MICQNMLIRHLQLVDNFKLQAKCLGLYEFVEAKTSVAVKEKNP